MKKYFSLISSWTLVLVISLISSSVSLTEADPTDDFSFTVGHMHPVELYHFMPIEQVTEVLLDHLDLFPRALAPRLAHHIVVLCKKFRLDPAFILSLIEVESGFRIKIASPVGALGLMQIMVPTANFVVREMGIPHSGHEIFRSKWLRKKSISEAQLVDPFVNTAIGIAYLAWLRDYYLGMPSHYALAAYNVGPARLDELLAQKSFRPVETKKYFLAIRQGVPWFRFYRRTKHVGSHRAQRNWRNQQPAVQGNLRQGNLRQGNLL